MSSERSPRLIIQKVRVVGEKGLALDQDLNDNGLTVIRGDNSSGRTTFIKLMEFALGATINVSRFFIPEVQNCQRVLVQISINNIPYTVARKIRRDSNIVQIYEGEIDGLLHQEPSVLSLEDLSNFLLYKLEIPKICYVDKFSNREKRISFEDIFDALYLDQENGFSGVQARIRGEQNRIQVFKLLTKTSIPELYEVEIEEESLKKEIKKNQQDYEAVSLFLGSVDLPGAVEIQSGIDELLIQRIEISNQLNNLKQQVRSTPGYISPLRSEIMNLESQITEIRQDIINTTKTLQSYRELENQLYDDLDRISRIKVSAYLLSSYDFEQCPRCLQPLTNDMKIQEVTGLCSVCGRQIKQDPENVEKYETYEKQIVAQLKELKDLQTYYISDTDHMNSNVSKLEKFLNQKKILLDDALQEYASPLLQEVENLGYKLSGIDQEVKRLEELANWRRNLEQMRDKLSEQISEINILQERKKILEEQEEAISYSIADFEAFFTQFIKGIYPGFIEAKINKKDFLPEINGYSYHAKSSTQKNIAIVGYYYSLIRFSLEYPSNIPRFLIIDTLRQDDISIEIYNNILSKFKELENTYKNSFQLILVVRDAVEFLRENEKLQLVNGTKLLMQ